MSDEDNDEVLCRSCRQNRKRQDEILCSFCADYWEVDAIERLGGMDPAERAKK